MRDINAEVDDLSWPSQPTDTYRHARARLDPVFAQIRATSADRDASSVLDQSAINSLRDAGFTRLRLPEDYGGDGLGFEEASWFMVALARADSNLAQAMRPHWLHVEDVLSRCTDTDEEAAYVERWLRRIGNGAVIGNALTERGNFLGHTTTMLGPETTDIAGSPVRLLNGTKFYSTGTAYADWILVTATDEDGQQVGLAVPAEASGITIVDDWDGFGQQLTASGTTKFEDTPVAVEDIEPPGGGIDSGQRVAFGQALAQYVHLATLVGIGMAAVDDVSDYVRSRSRGFSYAAADLPRNDPQVLQVIGTASAQMFGARAAFSTLLPELSRQLDADSEGIAVSDRDVDRLYLSVYQSQQLIVSSVTSVTNQIFEVGGASAITQSRALDRHWRNARVVSNHNPVIYRTRIIGDWEVNESPIPRAYRVGTKDDSEQEQGKQ